jgi:multicomponent Na+:H+ antiporter subunit D
MIDVTLYLLIPVITGTVLYLSNSHHVRRLALLVHFGLFAAAVQGFVYVKTHGAFVTSLGQWGAQVGIYMRVDMLSMTLLMLTAFMFAMMLLYEYNSTHTNQLYLFLFMVLQALVSAIFLSNDLFNIFVLIEVATITVAILIMFKQDRQSVYDGIVYMLVNIVAMNLFLFGVAFMYRTFGVLDMHAIGSKMHQIQNPVALIIPYSLMITAVALKSAIMPLFSWLPKAHGTPSAPSAVSAILSGLYVKTGVYLFVRINAMFAGTLDTWQFFLMVGFITAVIGFLLAISQKDIKLILAYHTISQIGLIMVGLNYPTDYAFWGGVYHILNHAFFKSTLFLGAGIVIDVYGTRNIWEIKGVFRKMPAVALASIMAVLGITGAPFFNGSISKYLIQSGTSGSVVEWGILLINLGTIISFIKYSTIFFGSSPADCQSRSQVDPWKKLSLLVMGAMCLIGGIWGQELIGLLFDQVMTIGVMTQLEKSVTYAITLVAGFVIYKQFVLKTNLFYKLSLFELDFNGICLSLTGFMVAMMVWLRVFVV